MGKYQEKPKTLCWKCTKSCTSGCSWSESFIPVEGWNAYETGSADLRSKSFFVISCPEFIEETPENKNRDLDNDGCLKMIEKLMEITRDDYIKGDDETVKEIRRFLRGRGAAKLHRIENPEEVIEMLDDARLAYRKKRANQILRPPKVGG